MTNLNTLVGFGAGGGSGSSIPKALTDSPTLVHSKLHNVGGNTTQLSSQQYNKIWPLETDGLFGGIADARAPSVNGNLHAISYLVNPSTGSIGNVNDTLNPSNNLYSHNAANTIFSTCHTGAVGNCAMYQGHSYNANSTGSRRGTAFGVKWDSNANIVQAAYGDGDSQNAWPHSDGELAMGCDSTQSNVYGRRSTYNVNTSVY